MHTDTLLDTHQQRNIQTHTEYTFNCMFTNTRNRMNVGLTMTYFFLAGKKRVFVQAVPPTCSLRDRAMRPWLSSPPPWEATLSSIFSCANSNLRLRLTCAYRRRRVRTKREILWITKVVSFRIHTWNLFAKHQWSFVPILQQSTGATFLLGLHNNN